MPIPEAALILEGAYSLRGPIPEGALIPDEAPDRALPYVGVLP